MVPYHIVLMHFPLALWTTAALIILVRALSDGPLAKASDRVLVPLLALGALLGLATYVVGFFIWPWESLTWSPLGRNHLLTATWSLTYWILLLITRWIQGEAVWEGVTRWVMLGLAGLGGILLTIAATMGGHIAGNPTAVSRVLHFLGWDVYDTFYLPDVMLWLLLAAAVIVLPAIGLWGSRRPA